MPERSGTPERVLIFRTGSLGDTAFNLPVFHHLNRLWPRAEKRVLTNFPVAMEAPPLQAVLGDVAFAQGYFEYPGGTRRIGDVLSLARAVRRWKPDIAVYMNECRGVAATLRDGLFLRLCGARRVYGLPLTAQARRHRIDAATGLHEREVSRIARALHALGEIDTDSAAGRDLALDPVELAAARAILADWPGRDRFVCFSPGTKQAAKDWTDPNWTAALTALGDAAAGAGLLIVGAREDRARAERLGACWPGPVLDVCGQTSPRVSAALMRDALLFLGNDSGPMHLAAAVGIPAVAVFSRLAPPGVWFPLGAAHRIFYPGLSWSGGDPAVCRTAAEEPDLTAIPVETVTRAAAGLLGR